jgi:hypothetical protein
MSPSFPPSHNDVTTTVSLLLVTLLTCNAKVRFKNMACNGHDLALFLLSDSESCSTNVDENVLPQLAFILVMN